MKDTGCDPIGNTMKTIEEVQLETREALSKRIKAATGDKTKLERLETSLTRLYTANCLSESDFKRFDDMIFHRLIKLER
jgi:hypothetical protein